MEGLRGYMVYGWSEAVCSVNVGIIRNCIAQPHEKLLTRSALYVSLNYVNLTRGLSMSESGNDSSQYRQLSH